MAEDVLALNGLSVELLTQLSYRSQLGLSLKRTLRHFEREALIAELTGEMLRAAEALEFERAADLRDRIRSLSSGK